VLAENALFELAEAPTDIQGLLENFPESHLLMIYANPYVVDYFAENISLLYMLDTQRSQITKEW